MQKRYVGSLGWIVVGVCWIALACDPSPTSLGESTSAYAFDELIVKFRFGVVQASEPTKPHRAGEAATVVDPRSVIQSAALTELNRSFGVTRMEPLFAWTDHPLLDDTYRLFTQKDVNIQDAVAAYAEKSDLVEYAQPNYEIELHGLPNDPYVSTLFSGQEPWEGDHREWSMRGWGQAYEDLWGLKKIEAHKAWSIPLQQEAVIAVVDTGLDYTHPDIKENVWVNPGEDLWCSDSQCPPLASGPEFPIGGDGRVCNCDFNQYDDDNNGFEDDVRGWDFTPQVASKPSADGDLVVWETREELAVWDIALHDRANHFAFRITSDPESDGFPVVSGNLIVWSRAPRGSLDFDIFACTYDAASRACVPYPAFRREGMQTNPSVFGKRILWVEHAVPLLVSKEIWLCEYNSLRHSCDSAKRIVQANNNISHAEISGDRIVWFEYYVENNFRKLDLFYCTYDPSAGCNPQRIDSPGPFPRHGGSLSISGDLVVYNCGASDEDYGICLYDFKSSTRRRIVPGPASDPTIDGYKIAWIRGPDFIDMLIAPPNQGLSFCVYDRDTGSCPEEYLTEQQEIFKSKPVLDEDWIVWVDSRFFSLWVEREFATSIFQMDLATRIETPLSSLEDADPSDFDGHGTHVAGTAAAIGNNGLGVIGVAPTNTVMALKGITEGRGRVSNLAEAIVYATTNGANVINNSWGCGYCPSNPIAEKAVRFAHEQGAVVVFSAGNDADNVQNRSPQNMTNPKPIVVAASMPDDAPHAFSNFGDRVDVVAPGGGARNAPAPPTFARDANILSLRAHYTGDPVLWVGRDYLRLWGTSMAAPHVSSLAALLRAHYPTITNEETRLRIRDTADPINYVGPNYYGTGRINVWRALGFPPNRIAASCGKVNQHTEDGDWTTDLNDPSSNCDAIPGMNTPEAYQTTLAYCRKFYRDTQRVEKFEIETIYDWKVPGNRGSVTKTAQTYVCRTD